MGKVALLLATKKATVLENYFVFSRNSSDPGPLQIPSTKKRPRPMASSEASTSSKESKDDECFTLKRSNIAMQLICPGGLPLRAEVSVGIEILDGIEIIDITDGDNATCEQRKKRLYEVSRKCQDHWTVQHP
jgi:hypothetical protein